MLIHTWQTTLRLPVEYSGKGLHSGRIVRMVIEPAPVDTGIVFTRADQTVAHVIPAKAKFVSATQLCTTLGTGSHSVATIEHLMAAFAGLGIHNARVIVDGPELPIMDGSAIDFVRGFMRVGLKESDMRARALRLVKPLHIEEDDKYLHLDPQTFQSIHCSIEFSSRAIGRQSLDYYESLRSFVTIADARTFCHLRDVESMRERGLALGGGLDNAVVVTDDVVLNEGGLRSADEFIRHKVLDLIGDFSLLGAPLVAKITAHKTGHGLHARCLQFLMDHKDEYLQAFYPEIEFESSASPEGLREPALPLPTTIRPLLSYA